MVTWFDLIGKAQVNVTLSNFIGETSGGSRATQSVTAVWVERRLGVSRVTQRGTIHWILVTLLYVDFIME